MSLPPDDCFDVLLEADRRAELRILYGEIALIVTIVSLAVLYRLLLY